MQQKPSTNWGLWAGLIAFSLLQLLPIPADMSPQAWQVAAITLLMMVWWFTEAIPVYVTALVPLALFPLLANIPASTLAARYGL